MYKITDGSQYFLPVRMTPMSFGLLPVDVIYSVVLGIMDPNDQPLLLMCKTDAGNLKDRSRSERRTFPWREFKKLSLSAEIESVAGYHDYWQTYTLPVM